MKVKTLEHDCYACPSSWSGVLEDGRYWRVRYRFGVMRLTVDPDRNNMSVFSRDVPEVFEDVQIGDEYDGVCDFDLVRKTFGHLIDFSASECDGRSTLLS